MTLSSVTKPKLSEVYTRRKKPLRTEELPTAQSPTPSTHAPLITTRPVDISVVPSTLEESALLRSAAQVQPPIHVDEEDTTRASTAAPASSAPIHMTWNLTLGSLVQLFLCSCIILAIVTIAQSWLPHEEFAVRVLSSAEIETAAIHYANCRDYLSNSAIDPHFVEFTLENMSRANLTAVEGSKTADKVASLISANILPRIAAMSPRLRRDSLAELEANIRKIGALSRQVLSHYGNAIGHTRAPESTIRDKLDLARSEHAKLEVERKSFWEVLRIWASSQEATETLQKYNDYEKSSSTLENALRAVKSMSGSLTEAKTRWVLCEENTEQTLADITRLGRDDNCAQEDLDALAQKVLQALRWVVYLPVVV
jgi:hypothetical protein